MLTPVPLPIAVVTTTLTWPGRLAEGVRAVIVMEFTTLGEITATPPIVTEVTLLKF